MSSSIGGGLLLVNAAGAAAATGYAAVSLWRSAGPRGRSALAVPPGRERFWCAQSAVRTAAVAVPLLVTVARARPDAGVLTVAGLVQLGDSAVGLWSRKPGMVVLPLVMGVVHLLTARRVSS